MRISSGIAAAVAAAAGLGALPAAAQPATLNVIQVGAGFRYGFELEEGDFNPWGPGLGVSGGYTLPPAIYAGAVFDYFFGDSVSELGTEISSNIWQLMGEGGYDIALGDSFVLRAKGGLGVASVRGEVCTDTGFGQTCASDSQADLVFAPGATFVYLGSGFSFSLDLRYDLIFADSTRKGLIFAAGIGF